MSDFPFFRFLRAIFKEEQPIDPKTNVAQYPRKPVHKRKKYRCFVCQTNEAQIRVIADRIETHPRLKNPTYGRLLTDDIDSIVAVAHDAHIILLSLDDHPHAIDALLDEAILGDKMVVVISNRHKAQKEIENRVDYWLPSKCIETDDSFQSLMAPVIDELDNDYPPRQATPIKPVYSCFIWQLGLEMQPLLDYIGKNERLCVTYSSYELMYSDQERSAVQEADILILSSGGDSPHSLIYFLDHYDIRRKVVIISTVFYADLVLDRTPFRIDYVLEKLKVTKPREFERFFAPIINDLDGGIDNEFQSNDNDDAI